MARTIPGQTKIQEREKMKMKTLAMAVGAAMLAGTAHAAPLTSLVGGGVLNTFQDDSRELLFDVNGDNRFSVGDVSVGILRINERVQPSGLPLLNDDELVVAFSVEVADITGGAVTWAPTTNASLTIDAIVGSFVPGGLPAPVVPGDAVGVVFTDVGFNPITTAASATGDLNSDGNENYLDTIARVAGNGRLELVAGMNGVDDFFRGTLAIDPSTFALTNLLGATTSFPVGVFSAGLSLLANESGREFTRDVCAGLVLPFGSSNAVPPPSCNPVSALLPGSLHDVTVGNGTLSGAANLAIAGDMFGSFNGINFYGLTNRAEVSVAPVPEPGPLMLLSLGMIGIPLAARLRRARDLG